MIIMIGFLLRVILWINWLYVCCKKVEFLNSIGWILVWVIVMVEEIDICLVIFMLK